MKTTVRRLKPTLLTQLSVIKTFANCSSLKHITTPTSVKKIESGAFSGCSSLQEIILPEGVVSIEDNSFSDCASLKNIKITNRVYSIKNEENI